MLEVGVWEPRATSQGRKLGVSPINKEYVFVDTSGQRVYGSVRKHGCHTLFGHMVQ